MITIIFESHSTTEDNETGLAAGWYDVALSEQGKRQARELGGRYQGQEFDAIFCSDLQRSYKTGQIAFGDQYPIIQDKRLRECDYGNMTRAPKADIQARRAQALHEPYPHGESFEDTSQRMKEFLQDLWQNYDNKAVMIIGHRATQYGLDRWIKDKSLKDAVLAPWQWQPGWQYELIKKP